MVDTAYLCTYIDSEYIGELMSGLQEYGKYYSKNTIFVENEGNDYYYCFTGLAYLGFSKIKIFKRNKYENRSFVEIKIRLRRLVEPGFCWEVIEVKCIKSALKNLQRYIKIINNYSSCNVLPKLSKWKLRRIDYAIDVQIDQKKEFYDIFKAVNVSKGLKAYNYATSCYLVGKMINVNFYDKSEWLKDKKIFHLSNESNIFRFEIQVKRRKIDKVWRYHDIAPILRNYCTIDIFKDLFLAYYSKIISTKDFHSFENAKIIILNQKISLKRSNYLLKCIEEIRSKGYGWWYVHKTRAQKKRFKQYMAELNMSWILFESDNVNIIENEVMKKILALNF